MQPGEIRPEGSRTASAVIFSADATGRRGESVRMITQRRMRRTPSNLSRSLPPAPIAPEVVTTELLAHLLEPAGDTHTAHKVSEAHWQRS